MLTYNPNYFLTSIPKIEDNYELREPQKLAYGGVKDHFIRKGKTTHAIVVLPTGVGKTGLMGILPYGVSAGRVLIITPQLVIKDDVIDSLDPDCPNNFWITRGVFDRINDLPCLIEYEGRSTRKEWLYAANIVVLNIHKLQKRLDSSLINMVEPDFFDMIIIDEAHHSTANTWVEAIEYFSKAKIVKLTGTPFRTDNEKIAGELVYKYKLSAAMAAGLVKSLESFTYVPEELYLTIDNDSSKLYSVDKLLALGIKDSDWISRSVAYSKDCSEKVVDKSIELLEKKLANNSNVPHKIIAVACSITHAKQIKELYEKKGYKCALIHSELEKAKKDEALKNIENHRVKVVIHVAMLGEGYDHPFLSIAAIFRPYRHILPYAQFIGRILRIIPPEIDTKPEDNIGQIVAHKHLGLEELWDYYKVEIHESETIKYLEEQSDYKDLYTDIGSGEKTQDRSVGLAFEEGTGTILGDTYLDTELIKERNKRIEEEQKKVQELQKLLKISEQEARKIINQAEGNNQSIKRPDLYFKRIGKDVDFRIKAEIVPELIEKYKIPKEDNCLQFLRIFRNKNFSWIPQRVKNNAGMLAAYFSHALNIRIGYKKEYWTPSDFEAADSKLDEIYEYVSKIMDETFS